MNPIPLKTATAAALLLFASSTLADITLGVFPRFAATATHTAFKPLADYLSQQLGEPVKLVTAKDFPSFWKGVEAKEYDLVHFNQYHYVKSYKTLGYRAIVANEEAGKRTIGGALVVHNDSNIKSVADLKGKKLLFVGDKQAMNSYVAQTALLKAAGLQEGTDYTIKFAKNPPSAAVGVFNREADAAGIGSTILNHPTVTSQIDVTKLSVLAKSEPFVQLPWAVGERIADDKAKKIQELMVGLSQSEAGKAILKAAMVDGFYTVTDSDFNAIRQIIRQATGEEL